MSNIEVIAVIVFGLLTGVLLLRHKDHLLLKGFGFHFYAGNDEPEETKAIPRRKRKRGNGK